MSAKKQNVAVAQIATKQTAQPNPQAGFDGEAGCETNCEALCEGAGSGCQISCTQACTTTCTTGGCETACEAMCEGAGGSCEAGCVTACDSACQTSCQSFCEGACASGCQVSCEETCESTCQISEMHCDVGCESLARSVRFSSQAKSMSLPGCAANAEVYVVLTANFSEPSDNTVKADHPERAKVFVESLGLPIVAPIIAARFTIEPTRATLAPGSEVTVQTPDGRQIRATTLVTTAFILRTPMTGVVNVTEGALERQISAPVMTTEGRYLRDIGIEVEAGTPMTLLVRGKIVSGKSLENPKLGAKLLRSEAVDAEGKPAGDPVQAKSSAVDKWLHAKVLTEESGSAVYAKIVSGEVDVEIDKVSFRAGTKVKAIGAGGRLLSGVLIGSAAIPLVSPIHALVETDSAAGRLLIAGLLLHAKGFYRAAEGVSVSAGNAAIVLRDANAITGTISEDMEVAPGLLQAAVPLRGFRRLTQ